VISSSIAIGLDISETPTKKLLYIRDVPFKVVFQMKSHSEQGTEMQYQLEQRADQRATVEEHDEFEEEECDEDEESTHNLHFNESRFMQYINNSFHFNVRNFPSSYDPLVCELAGVHASEEQRRNRKPDEMAISITHCMIDYENNYVIMETYNYYALQFLLRKDLRVMNIDKIPYYVTVVTEFAEPLREFNTNETDIKLIADIKDKIFNRKAVANSIVSTIFNIDRKGLYTIAYKKSQENIGTEYQQYKKFTSIDFGRWHANGRLIPQTLKNWVIKNIDLDEGVVAQTETQRGDTNGSSVNCNPSITSKYVVDQRNIVNHANLDNTYCKDERCLNYCRNLLAKFLLLVEQKINESGMDPKYLPAKMDIFDSSNLMDHIDVETIHLYFDNIRITKNLKNRLNASEFNLSKKSSSGDKTFKKKALHKKMLAIRAVIHTGKIAPGKIEDLKRERDGIKKSDATAAEKNSKISIIDSHIKELLNALGELEKNKAILDDYQRQMEELETKSTSVNKPEVTRHFTFSEAIELQNKIETYEEYLNKRKREDEEEENSPDGDEECGRPRKRFKPNEEYDNTIKKELQEAKAQLDIIQSGQSKVVNKKITDFFGKKTT
jgi:hypothetical protein